MPNTIEIKNVSKTFRGMVRPALEKVSLSIEVGSVTGIIGPNGAGKTTLMGCLLGLLKPDAGTISIGGRSPQDVEIRRQFGYVPERLTFDRWMRAENFISFHHALAGLPAQNRKQDVKEALRKVGLDEESWRKPVRSFSRGMLQRLGLAQAILGNPRFIFLDEPTSGMDPAGVLLFKTLVREKAKQGAIVVLNSHQLSQVEALCDRVCFLKQGQVTSDMNQRQVKDGVIFSMRWLSTHSGVTNNILEKLSKKSGCDLQNFKKKSSEASFIAKSDKERNSLIALAMKSGIPIAEARIESKGLESLFEELP